jgi:hypothetical protein
MSPRGPQNLQNLRFLFASYACIRRFPSPPRRGGDAPSSATAGCPSPTATPAGRSSPEAIRPPDPGAGTADQGVFSGPVPGARHCPPARQPIEEGMSFPTNARPLLDLKGTGEARRTSASLILKDLVRNLLV